jgi:hypothetical protein
MPTFSACYGRYEEAFHSANVPAVWTKDTVLKKAAPVLSIFINYYFAQNHRVCLFTNVFHLHVMEGDTHSVGFTDHATPLYLQKLALTSPTIGGCSVGIVRSRTKATELVR